MIDTNAKLAAFLPVVKSAAWLALDTEADSLHAYPEKVCLIQISTVAGDELIDPLAQINLDPLLDALDAHELILHAADYDLRLLLKHHKFTPSAIFDTMLAARLLGETQFGLSHLVVKFLGVTLDKGSQKADWAQRPLTLRMENYARNDTHYLKPLADKLKIALHEKNRLAWHQESCVRLIEDCSRPPVVDADSVWRVRGSSFLSRHALAILRELWHWREHEAITANRPPFFVLAHETLVKISVAIAEQQPFEPLVPPRMHPRRRENLFHAIAKARKISPDHFPQIIRNETQRPNEAEFRRFRELQKHRDQHAHALNIDPTLIASKAMLGNLARDWEKFAPALMNWQRELLKK